MLILDPLPVSTGLQNGVDAINSDVSVAISASCTRTHTHTDLVHV